MLRLRTNWHENRLCRPQGTSIDICRRLPMTQQDGKKLSKKSNRLSMLCELCVIFLLGLDYFFYFFAGDIRIGL
jgi:hypothetical protein